MTIWEKAWDCGCIRYGEPYTPAVDGPNPPFILDHATISCKIDDYTFEYKHTFQHKSFHSTEYMGVTYTNRQNVERKNIMNELNKHKRKALNKIKRELPEEERVIIAETLLKIPDEFLRSYAL